MARKPAPTGPDRRQRILEAALDVFAEQGFEGATTKDVAARAEVTHGLIYFYFPSKEDLFYAAFEHQVQRSFDALRFDLDDESDSAADVETIIRRIVTRFIDIMLSPRNLSLMRIMMRAAAQDMGRSQALRDSPTDAAVSEVPWPRSPIADQRRRIGECSAQLTNQLSDYLRAQMTQGRFRLADPHITAELLIGSLAVTVISRAKNRTNSEGELDAIQRNALIDAFTNVFAYGLTPDPITMANRSAISPSAAALDSAVPGAHAATLPFSSPVRSPIDAAKRQTTQTIEGI